MLLTVVTTISGALPQPTVVTPDFPILDINQPVSETATTSTPTNEIGDDIQDIEADDNFPPHPQEPENPQESEQAQKTPASTNKSPLSEKQTKKRLLETIKKLREKSKSDEKIKADLRAKNARHIKDKDSLRRQLRLERTAVTGLKKAGNNL